MLLTASMLAGWRPFKELNAEASLQTNCVDLSVVFLPEEALNEADCCHRFYTQAYCMYAGRQVAAQYLSTKERGIRLWR